MKLKDIEPAIKDFSGGMGNKSFVMKRGEITRAGYLATATNLYTAERMEEYAKAKALEMFELTTSGDAEDPFKDYCMNRLFGVVGEED